MLLMRRYGSKEFLTIKLDTENVESKKFGFIRAAADEFW